ncbi:HAMP domain-containing histidine kinase, partial [candidate division KSB1 bacterium]|nr:HAMP domain-containing histidine kinase [candidate division KSB1 bacterium]
LTEIKNTIYGIYSTDAINVIANTTNALEELFRENKIEIRRVKIDIENAQVLITNHELADILDNCLRNSVRALSNKSKRLIEISVYRSAPKIHIDIKDNGCGIAQERWEKVFESGYSEHGGTGTGLFQAWEILKKYGGRLYIKESQLGIGTTFTIDLNAGEKK